MKYLAMVERGPNDEVPSQGLEASVLASVDSLGLEMPPVRRGWRRETPDTIEIGPVAFAGAKPIWYWEVK